MARKAFCIVANDERGCAFLSPSYLLGRQCGAVFVRTTRGLFRFARGPGEANLLVPDPAARPSQMNTLEVSW